MFDSGNILAKNLMFYDDSHTSGRVGFCCVLVNDDNGTPALPISNAVVDGWVWIWERDGPKEDILLMPPDHSSTIGAVIRGGAEFIHSIEPSSPTIYSPLRDSWNALSTHTAHILGWKRYLWGIRTKMSTFWACQEELRNPTNFNSIDSSTSFLCTLKLLYFLTNVFILLLCTRVLRKTFPRGGIITKTTWSSSLILLAATPFLPYYFWSSPYPEICQTISGARAGQIKGGEGEWLRERVGSLQLQTWTLPSDITKCQLGFRAI